MHACVCAAGRGDKVPGRVGEASPNTHHAPPKKLKPPERNRRASCSPNGYQLVVRPGIRTSQADMRGLDVERHAMGESVTTTKTRILCLGGTSPPGNPVSAPWLLPGRGEARRRLHGPLPRTHTPCLVGGVAGVSEAT